MQVRVILDVLHGDQVIQVQLQRLVTLSLAVLGFEEVAGQDGGDRTLGWQLGQDDAVIALGVVQVLG